MNTFLSTLKNRNAVLYYFGWVCIAGTVVCGSLVFLTNGSVLGINAYIKPAKFFISVALFCWTMSWFTGLLTQRRKVMIYAWVTVVVFTIELAIVVGQAALGKLSHFNISSPLDGLLFSLMGILITLFTIWTAYIGYLFFRHKSATLEPSYLWGIRLGILVFVIFAFQGFMMATRLSHTVGAPDGGAGLPVTNWSTRYGDLRVAHFFGMHALQLIPLFSYYIARRPRQVMLFSVFYFIVVSLLLMGALAGKPLLTILAN